ncbi:hypothetical protein JL37_13130 [Achromobacter sp. RTa]|uniref:glycosyltransferase family 4 protein n=1 Tax=Achromobacter sp. RTa TaxID=1532557 RepID=UPI00050F2798|nr:glycosyltransferase family 4 protein [Achromobacter sp. RTa]KGD93910.1 hypothetical protein JL37_13130 [Achromobacter sp. RTa]
MSDGLHSLLIVTQSFEVGGLETYIAGQVRVMAAQGWAIHMACGSEPAEEFLPPGLSSVTGGLNLGPGATAADLVATVESLRSIIREHAVTHVHGHPFTSVFPAMLAAALERVPFMLTLHGPASLSAGYGPINDFLLTSLALPLSQGVIAVSDEVMELAAPYVSGDALRLQSNAIDFSKFGQSASSAPEGAPWLVVSRLDGLKIPGIRAFVNQANTLGLGGVDIVGDGPGRETLQEWLEQDGVGHVVRFLGARSDVPDLMRSCAGVAGMGRVLLEGVASGKPVCVVGYDGVKGLLDADLFRRAAYANFSGRNLPNVDAQGLARQFERAPAGAAELADIALQQHSEDRTWSVFAKRITSFTCNAHSPIRAVYSVLRSEDAIASPGPYLASENLFYQIGRVLHGSTFFSPATAASYAFYEARIRALRDVDWHEEAGASAMRIMQVSETSSLETKAAVSQVDTHTVKDMERISGELQRLSAQCDQHRDELAKAVKVFEDAAEEIATCLQQPRTWRQRISDVVRGFSARDR